MNTAKSTSTAPSVIAAAMVLRCLGPSSSSFNIVSFQVVSHYSDPVKVKPWVENRGNDRQRLCCLFSSTVTCFPAKSFYALLLSKHISFMIEPNNLTLLTALRGGRPVRFLPCGSHCLQF